MGLSQVPGVNGHGEVSGALVLPENIVQLYQKSLKKADGKIDHYVMETLHGTETSVFPVVTCGFGATENKISAGSLVDIHKLVF